MPTARKSARDFTGLNQERLQKANAKNQAKQAELSMITAQAVEDDANEIHDYTGRMVSVTPRAPENEVELKKPNQTMRVTEDIENMTFGRAIYQPGDADHPHGPPRPEDPEHPSNFAYVGPLTSYDFTQGNSYTVPYELARHLDERGFVWH